MLTGRVVGLRARHEDDIDALRTGLYDDVLNSARAEGAPWRPMLPGSKDARLTGDDSDPSRVIFSVVSLEDESLIGTATFWGIDTHHRSAHLGLGVLPAARGKGYGSDIVAVLCHYGFVVRGLHRLQVETLADNHAMLAAAQKNGFVREGVTRSSSWVMGEWLDEVVLGLLAEEWQHESAAQPREPNESSTAQS